jgi:hypothetical protein
MVPEISTGRGAKIMKTPHAKVPVLISRAAKGGILKLGGGAQGSLASGKIFTPSLRSRSSLVAYTRRQAGDWLGPIKT